jgi:hypothetical protein
VLSFARNLQVRSRQVCRDNAQKRQAEDSDYRRQYIDRKSQDGSTQSGTKMKNGIQHLK